MYGKIQWYTVSLVTTLGVKNMTDFWFAFFSFKFHNWILICFFLTSRVMKIVLHLCVRHSGVLEQKKWKAPILVHVSCAG